MKNYPPLQQRHHPARGKVATAPGRALAWLAWLLWLLLAAAVMLAAAPARAVSEAQLRLLKLPPGFSIELWARADNARQMTLGAHDDDGGVVYVGSRRAGKVYAVPYDKHYRAGRVRVVASGLRLPVGVAWRDGDLYVSAVSRILRFTAIDQRLDAPPPPQVVNDSLPTESAHGWKFIAFGPDGFLYVPVGAPCNICDPDPRRYANIQRLDPHSGELSPFVAGVRNSVGFDWHPLTAKMWFTDNGRDHLGDDAPPDELNHAPRAGMHFGYPWCHGGDIPDPEYGDSRRCSEFTPPAQRLGAHVASLGMRFYRGAMFPGRYRNQIFIAEHGSWNRSRKNGYRVSLVRLQGDKAVAYETFVSGWLQGERVWGRPADVMELPDGSLLVSDDFANVIYRITWR